MRHVPMAEFKDKMAETIAAAEAGEDIVITRHGRQTVRLVPVDEERRARQHAAIKGLIALGEEIRTKYGPTTRAEIRDWIDEGRP